MSHIILSTLQKHGLDIQFLRGQGYDGAGSVARCTSGVAARIQSKCPLALYTHCYSHKLNLAMVNACKVPGIRNAMGIITKVAFILKIPLRDRKHLKQRLLQQTMMNSQIEKSIYWIFVGRNGSLVGCFVGRFVG